MERGRQERDGREGRERAIGDRDEREGLEIGTKKGQERRMRVRNRGE